VCVLVLDVEFDYDDGSSQSSRTSILSRTRRFNRWPATQRKDVLATDVDDIDKMKVISVTVLSGQLSLAIPLWVGEVSTSRSDGHDALVPYLWSGSVSQCLAES